LNSKVKEMMVVVEDYATVSQTATLAEAMVALEEAQQRHQRSNPKYKHRALLVTNDAGEIVGKLSMIDVVRALVPHHHDNDALSRFGFSRGFVDTATRKFEGLQAPLETLCATVAGVRVSEVMAKPTPGEFVDEDADLESAVVQLVQGSHQSLLVTHGEDVVGILRLADVFHAVCEALAGCV